MTIKSSKTLIDEALSVVKTISPEEALKKIKDNQCNLVDIRETIELQKEGSIEESFHIPRGLLEFSINPESPYIKNEKFTPNETLFLFVCLLL